MSLSRRSLLGASLGLGALIVAPRGPIGAQSPTSQNSIDPTLAGYLDLAPASVASLGAANPLTFGNAKLQMDTMGFPLPFDPADKPALQNWIHACYPVVLPSPFRNYFLMDGFADMTGFDPGQVFSGAEMGDPPNTVTMIRGAFDTERIQAAQLANGYQQREIDGRPIFSLAEKADFSLDNPIQQWALARLNNATVLDDGTMVYAPTLDLLRAVLAGSDPLGANPLVQQAMGALDGPLITAMIVGPSGLAPGLPPSARQPQSQEEIAAFMRTAQAQQHSPAVLSAIFGVTPGGPLPALGDDATPQPTDAPKSLTKIALVYANAMDAQTAAAQIQGRLSVGSSLIIDSPWSEMLNSFSVAARGDSPTVLVTMEWPAAPRALELVYNRDTAFITG